MELTVNGKPHRTAAATIAGLLDELGHAGGPVAVAVNREVVRRGDWTVAGLNPGDAVEIVSPRQGG